MNTKLVGRIIGLVLLIEAAFMLVPLFIGAVDGEADVVFAFGVTIGIILPVSIALLLLTKNRGSDFFTQESFVATALSWLFMSLFGCLPFIISGQIPNFIDAWFEIVSGFTTTGASILTDVEALSRGMLYWRSFSHWLGGMGVLVFLMALIPASSKGRNSDMYLLRAESPGPEVGKFTPKLRHTAMILYVIYIVLTALDVLFLRLGNMPWFDSVCIAFGTAGTGGFGVLNSSMGSYSVFAQVTTTVFMLLFGVNFNIYYLIILGKLRAVFKNTEFFAYLGFYFGATALVFFDIFRLFDNSAAALHHAAFQTASIMTTTGFATVDFEQWPFFSKSILLILMCIGASAGSTGGGIKVARVVLMLKKLHRGVRKVLQPNRTVVLKLDGHVVSEQTISGVGSYLVAYVMIIVVSFLLISVDEKSITTNIAAVLACFNNIGPGLEEVGATGNYSGFSGFSKLVLSADMLLGRLEIFPLLVLLSKTAWDRRK